jgi:serine phosphatase RsbU (regulator of sigma subunit)/Tfp pilus assembly protein PilF
MKSSLSSCTIELIIRTRIIINVNAISLFLACCLAFLPHAALAQTRSIDSLLALLQTPQKDTSKVTIYAALCRAYMVELNDMDKVKEYATKLYSVAKPISNKRGLAHGTFYRGLAEWNKGNYEVALANFRDAMLLFHELGMTRSEIGCYINSGQIYTAMGQFQKARTAITKGLQLNQEINDKLIMQGGYISLGSIYSVEGNYAAAIDNHLKALKIAEERNDVVVATCANNNIGDVFYAQNRWDQALSYYEKALAGSEAIKETRMAGSIYTGIGNVYLKKKQYAKALTYHFKDLKLKTNDDDKQGIAYACSQIGLDYLSLHELQKALSYQLKSYNLFKQIKSKKGLIDASGGIGKVYEEKEEYSKALIYYNEMLEITKELDYREGVRDAYENLASVYRKLHIYDKSLVYTDLFHNEKDSLLNKDNFKQIAELNTRYETDKKEKEILLLTKDQQLNAKIIKQQQFVRWGLIGGLLLLIISIASIYRRFRFKQKANEILKKQKEEIQQKNLLITDSIDYAQTIQEAVLPTQQKVQLLLPESFILYKPKAVVSGDFYWIGEATNRLICAVADCTGHGVPGAFMSLLGYNMLESAVKSADAAIPAFILDALEQEITTRLPSNSPGELSKHGMDMSLISIDKKNNRLEFAGAHNDLYIVRNGQLIELKADKMGLGGNTKRTSFTNQFIFLEKGDMIYLFTDGFPDQRGGVNNKKFYYTPFKELLVSISTLTLNEQKRKLDTAHINWMGEKKDQTDDILILGIKWI